LEAVIYVVELFFANTIILYLWGTTV